MVANPIPFLLWRGTLGYFHEYIGRNLSATEVEAERRRQLRRIGEILDCDVLTYAARLSQVPVPLPVAVLPEDILMFTDLVGSLKQKRVAVILETLGGSGETGRQMVEILHERFDHVCFIVPGVAKSTGTIMVLGGHEILMGPGSALGPIDAQIQQEGKVYSADALIEGLSRIKREIEENGGKLNPAYIPFLQKLSPGEIEHAHNALAFARETVREWLVRYKFGKWAVRKTSGKPVTDEYKKKRANEIANALSSQAKWKTHGRSLRAPDLVALGLEIEDFTKRPDLSEAIQRYYALLRLTLDGGDTYKIMETTEAAVRRRMAAIGPQPVAAQGQTAVPRDVDAITMEVPCHACGTVMAVQLDFKKGVPLTPGAIRYPQSGHAPCSSCGQLVNCAQIRAVVEAQVGRQALNPPNRR
jgi:hypothetical protein